MSLTVLDFTLYLVKNISATRRLTSGTKAIVESLSSFC